MNVLPLLSCLIRSQVFWKTLAHILVPYPKSSTTPVLHSNFLTSVIPYAPTVPLEHPPFLDTDIFKRKDESSHASVNEIDEAEKEIEEFERVCNMSKPSMNRPKVI